MACSSTNILILCLRNLQLSGVVGEMVSENKEPGESYMLLFYYYVDNLNLQYLKNTCCYWFLRVVYRCFIRYNIGYNTLLFIWNISNARTEATHSHTTNLCHDLSLIPKIHIFFFCKRKSYTLNFKVHGSVTHKASHPLIQVLTYMNNGSFQPDLETTMLVTSDLSVSITENLWIQRLCICLSCQNHKSLISTSTTAYKRNAFL